MWSPWVRPDDGVALSLVATSSEGEGSCGKESRAAQLLSFDAIAGAPFVHSVHACCLVRPLTPPVLVCAWFVAAILLLCLCPLTGCFRSLIFWASLWVL